MYIFWIFYFMVLRLLYLPVFLFIYIFTFNLKEWSDIKEVFILFLGSNFLYNIYLFYLLDIKSLGFQLNSEFGGFTFGLDGFGFLLIILTTFLMPFCLLISWEIINHRSFDFFYFFIVLEFLLVLVFSCLNVLVFYIFFESILIPMFFLIGVWGSRLRRIHAAYQFFFYTLLGSIFMLISLLYVFYDKTSLDIELLYFLDYSISIEFLLWFTFFLSFAVKMPLYPVHIWLPEAHVEAPTSGSVLLAGILLKLGSYGVLRFLFPLFPLGSSYNLPTVFVFSLLGIVYISLLTIRQNDLKKIIAYSSVAHMSLVNAGMFSLNVVGLGGSIFLMLSHGFVSSGLFYSIGVLYDRYKTRVVYYFGGLVNLMPVFSIVFLILSLANIAFPGTSSFVAELWILLGLFEASKVLCFVSGFGVILSACYSIWLYNRVIFLPLKYEFLHKYCDLNHREFYIFTAIIALIFIFGIYPKLLSDIFYSDVLNLVEYKI